jgi:hypothetical protein
MVITRPPTLGERRVLSVAKAKRASKSPDKQESTSVGCIADCTFFSGRAPERRPIDLEGESLEGSAEILL